MKKTKNRIQFFAMLVMCCLVVCGTHMNTMAKSVKQKNITNISLKINNKNVTNKTYKIKAGNKKKIIVSASPKKVDKTVKYYSENKKVATINSKGTLSAKKKGMAKIRVTISAKNYKTKTVWVKIKVQGTDNKTPEEPTTPVPDKPSVKKNVVIYFSCTNSTKRVAELIAESLDADVYRIEASEPYTDADLDYTDPNSRTSKENSDASARPGISGKLPSLDGYTNIYIGYPIWHGQAPKIMYTFVEHYNLSEKLIIPFCTSASSGIGTSAANLENSAKWKSTWLKGRRFSGDCSKSTIENWISELGVN